jgi:hypothetical protein
MFIEEFYKYDGKDVTDVADIVYLTTLQSWLIYNELSIYESLLVTFEEMEQYAICEGIHRALSKVEDIMDERFSEANKLAESDSGYTVTHEEHNRVSRLVFEDILKEIYEKQIGKYKKNN